MRGWTIREHFGRIWPPQLVSQDLPDTAALSPTLDLATDEGDHLVAQRDGDRLLWICDLQPGQIRTFTVADSAREATASEPDSVDRPACHGGGLIQAGPAGIEMAGLRLAVGADPASTMTGLRRVDGTWAQVTSYWQGCQVVERSHQTLADGPILSRVRQSFELVEGAIVHLTWEVDIASHAIRLDVASDRTLPADLTLDLADVCPPRLAYWRPHSPRRWRGDRGTSHHRQIYEIPETATQTFDEVEIGPFYNWARDAGSFWTCWGPDAPGLLYLGWIRPSLTHLPEGLRRLRLQAASGAEGDVRLHIPIQRGTFRIAIAVAERPAQLRVDGGANEIDALHTRLNGPNLDDLGRMDLEFVDEPGGTDPSYPRLWADQMHLPELRRRFDAWGWLRERFEEHIDDRIFDTASAPNLQLDEQPPTLGQDPAGAFLVSGDPVHATRAMQQLARDLEQIVELLLDYGPSVDAALGISVARPWRALVVNLDLVLGAASVSDEQRARILRQLAFIAEVQSTHDAWPAGSSGIPRGNQNFHPDVVSARGLGAALLNGHRRQHRWLETAVQEMIAFLERYHRASGVSEEAATYQLVCLGYALQLHAAASRRGYGDLATCDALHRSFDFLASTQTPVDDRCGYRMLPTIGHVTIYAWCQTLQAYFAWAAQATAGTEFSRRMMRAWQRGGGHVISLHDYRQHNIWSQPMLLMNHELPCGTIDEDLSTSRLHEGLGAVLRAHHEDGTEGYVLAKMGESCGHFDQDEGSFIWYAWGQPVLVDFGTQYDPNFDAHPWLHNRISFDHKADGAPRDGRCLAGQLNDGFDYLCGEVVVRSQFFHGEWPNRDPDYDMRQAGDPWELPSPQRWRRHLLYLHDLEVIVLLDAFDSTLPTDWNLQVHAEHVTTGPGQAAFAGRFGVDLDVYLLRPSASSLAVSGYSHSGFDEPRGAKWWWRGARWTAAQNTSITAMAEQALTLRAHANPGECYFAVLAARRTDEAPAKVESRGDWGVQIATATGSATVSTTAPCTAWQVEISSRAGQRAFRVDAPAGS